MQQNAGVVVIDVSDPTNPRDDRVAGRYPRRAEPA